MNKLDLIILILSIIFISILIIFLLKSKNFFGIFGSNQQSGNNSTTTPQPTTTTPQPTTTKPPSCISCINGTCVNGVCICEPGYTGFNCLNEIKCPNNCNGNGACKLGKCECNKNWIGDNCTIYNANWYDKIYTTNLSCKTNELSCQPGKCCINNNCINCAQDTIIQTNGQYDGQKPTCKVVSNNFCDVGDYCQYNGQCIESAIYAASNYNIIKSIFGNIWEIVKIVLPDNIDFYGFNNLYYNNNKFVLTTFMSYDKTTYTQKHSILYSSDGINWNLSNGDNIVSGKKAIYNKNIWIIVGGFTAVQNTIIYSSDAITWKAATPNLMDRINDISFNDNIFVAVGNKSDTLLNTIIWSSDGKTWIGLGVSVFDGSGYAIKWNEKQQLWSAFGSNLNEDTISAWSTDGKNWTVINNDPFENYISDNFDEKFPIICDSRGYTEISANATEKPPNILTIEQQSTKKYVGEYDFDQCESQNCFTYFCLDRAPLQGQTTWVDGSISRVISDIYKKVVCNPSVNCRVPIIGGILNKSNPLTIECNDSIWISTGKGKNTIVYSLDGKTWSKTLTGNIFNEVDNPYAYQSYKPDNGYGSSITYNKDTKTWIVAGSGYDGIGRTVATSKDGISWASVANSSNYPDVKSVQWIYLPVV